MPASLQYVGIVKIRFRSRVIHKSLLHSQMRSFAYDFMFNLPGGYCHSEPPGELYFLVLCLIIPGGICHAEPPDYGIRIPVIPPMVPPK